jgi:hypothetical protein
MDANTPVTLAAARYSDRDGAVNDYHTVWGAKHEGEFDHMALAVLTKDANGNLQVERHDSTAKHLAWGGAILGAALTVVAPPVGAAVLAGGAASACRGDRWPLPSHHSQGGHRGRRQPARVGGVRPSRGCRQPPRRRH